jgi:hypothetical protein
MLFVLATSYFFPRGLINYSVFESESILIAQRRGVASCMTTLKLYEDKKFLDRNICFGVFEVTGKYRLEGDTIFFENVNLGRHVDKYYKFALISSVENKSNSPKEIILYKDNSDIKGMTLWIIKNDIN